MYVHQHGARRVGIIGHMITSAGKFPHQPRVYRAHQQFALFRPFARSGNVVENPFGTACGEIRIYEQSALLLHHLAVAVSLQLVAYLRATHALPYHGVAHGLACCLVPHHHRLALVCDGKRIIVLRDILVFEQAFHGLDHIAVNLLRVVFHPSGLGIILPVSHVHALQHLTFFGEKHGLCGRRALVYCYYIVHGICSSCIYFKS